MLVGVDGYKGGWVAVIATGRHMEAHVFPEWASLRAREDQCGEISGGEGEGEEHEIFGALAAP